MGIEMNMDVHIHREILIVRILKFLSWCNGCIRDSSLEDLTVLCFNLSTQELTTTMTRTTIDKLEENKSKELINELYLITFKYDSFCLSKSSHYVSRLASRIRFFDSALRVYSKKGADLRLTVARGWVPRNEKRKKKKRRGVRCRGCRWLGEL